MSYNQIAIISKEEIMNQYRSDLNTFQKRCIKQIQNYHDKVSHLATWAVLSLKVNFQMIIWLYDSLPPLDIVGMMVW